MLLRYFKDYFEIVPVTPIITGIIIIIIIIIITIIIIIIIIIITATVIITMTVKIYSIIINYESITNGFDL